MSTLTARLAAYLLHPPADPAPAAPAAEVPAGSRLVPPPGPAASPDAGAVPGAGAAPSREPGEAAEGSARSAFARPPDAAASLEPSGEPAPSAVVAPAVPPGHPMPVHPAAPDPAAAPWRRAGRSSKRRILPRGAAAVAGRSAVPLPGSSSVAGGGASTAQVVFRTLGPSAMPRGLAPAGASTVVGPDGPARAVPRELAAPGSPAVVGPDGAAARAAGPTVPRGLDAAGASTVVGPDGPARAVPRELAALGSPAVVGPDGAGRAMERGALTTPAAGAWAAPEPTRQPAAAGGSGPWRAGGPTVCVVGTGAGAATLGAVIAVRLGRAHRPQPVVLATWPGRPPGGGRPGTATARHVAAVLGQTLEGPVTAAGRTVLVPLGDDAIRAADAATALAERGEPTVVVLAGPRPDVFEALLRQVDLVVVATPADAAAGLGDLAAGVIERAAPGVRVSRVETSGRGRRLARAAGLWAAVDTLAPPRTPTRPRRPW